MTSEGEAPHPQGAEGSAVVDDSLADEERQALGQLIEAFPGSTVGATIPNGETPPRAIDDPAIDEPDEGELVLTNFAKLLADGIPEPEYVLFPYLPKAARVWAFGPAESSKTIWTQWVASKVTHEGRQVVLVSAENPLETDVRQLSRLRPNWGRLRHYHMPAIDLADPSRFVEPR